MVPTSLSDAVEGICFEAEFVSEIESLHLLELSALHGHIVLNSNLRVRE